MRAARKALRGAAERPGEGVPRWRRRSYLSVSVKTEKHTLALTRRTLSRCQEFVELEGRGDFLEKMSWESCTSDLRLLVGREDVLGQPGPLLSDAGEAAGRVLSLWVDGKSWSSLLPSEGMEKEREFGGSLGLYWPSGPQVSDQ
ncbi:unnamed protein product [Pleuronectes platessa]|uniref:Uncharacterized protein n=1 Tax=Pleuronectes platessa TaxID=8262 RepID=A0A9N7VHT5_PLEPL|nr:unnamed protein product [Pleuronectes platessa]